jgi:hypothetical protein
MFGICWTGNATTDFLSFCNDVNNFGKLTWDILDQELSSTVNFLDLTLSIQGHKIVSQIYQKEMNLYLYIPPASAHPAGCIKSTVFGLTRRYYAQNTFHRDYIHFIKLLYHHLIQRGWDQSKIRQMILDACTTVKRVNKTPAAPTILDRALRTRFARKMTIKIAFYSFYLPPRRHSKETNSRAVRAALWQIAPRRDRHCSANHGLLLRTTEKYRRPHHQSQALSSPWHYFINYFGGV